MISAHTHKPCVKLHMQSPSQTLIITVHVLELVTSKLTLYQLTNLNCSHIHDLYEQENVIWQIWDSGLWSFKPSRLSDVLQLLSNHSIHHIRHTVRLNGRYHKHFLYRLYCTAISASAILHLIIPQRSNTLRTQSNK